jgi:Spy/CpxP family protein refolding chaperone
MKKSFVLILTAFFLAGATVRAAEEVATTSKRADRQADERAEHLIKALELNPEQQKKVRDIERQGERRKMEVDGQTDNEVRAALTPEQQSRFDKMKS